MPRKCIQCKKKQPSLGLPTDKTSTYCGDCKKEGMVNLLNSKCIECNKKLPTFGLPTDKKATYCGDCKTENMKNIKDKKCIKCNNKQPVFGLPTDKTPTYCGDCKTECMENIKDKKCIKCNNKRPNFGLSTDKIATYCGDCKTENMKNIKDKKCIKCNNKQPVFGLPTDKTPTYCGDCKTENMKDLKNKKCLTYLCDTQPSNPKYRGYCCRCFFNTFPNEPVSRNYKTKEFAVFQFIKESFPDIDIVSDRSITGKQYAKRPDILIDLGNIVIIIEIDEDKHSRYENICENKRIMEISQDLGHRPMILIRFNPDAYKINDRRVASCWGIEKLYGICVVKNKKEWNERLKTLKGCVEYWMKQGTEKTIESVYLYYDE